MRPWGLIVLVLYAVLLVLGSLPEEVRPAFLDAPSTLSRAALAKVGIAPGVAVFEPPGFRVTRVLLNDCIHVRGLRAGAAAERLHPPDGGCQTHGLRLFRPRREAVWRHILLRAATPLNQAVLGDFHCHPDGERVARFDTVEVLWSQPWRALHGPERGVAHVIWFRWQCEPPALLEEIRSPSDAEVRAHWGSP